MHLSIVFKRYKHKYRVQRVERERQRRQSKQATYNSPNEVRLENDDGIGPRNEVPSSLLHETIYMGLQSLEY